MTNKQLEILKTFNDLLPKLTPLEQEKLLAFGEGVALMAGRFHESDAAPAQ